MSRKKTDELPHSVEAEQGVLSSGMQDPKCLPLIFEKVTEEHFHIPAHRSIFLEMKSRWEKGESLDLIVLTQHMRDMNLLDEIGGAAALTVIYNLAPNSTNVAYYIEIVMEKLILRQLIASTEATQKRARENQAEAKEVLAEAQVSIMSLKWRDEKEEKSLHELVLDKLDRMQQGEPDTDIIPTKIKKLDELSPLRSGDMPIIAGERKDGKSILALTILENICISQKRPGLLFSLEDRKAKVMDRIFAGVSRIPMNRHHISKMSPVENEAATKAADKIKTANLIIVDDLFDLTAIIAKARHVFAEHPELAIAVIDYAQLVKAVVKKGGTRQEEVAAVSRAFRLFAMETGVPTVLLSQLNKDGETRESKALEQDGTACWKIKQVKDERAKRKIEIPWQRNGPSGEVFEVGFFGEIARVENPARGPDFVHPRNKAENNV